MFDKFAKEFLTYILENEPDFINCFDWIMAHCCLETGYFTSELSTKYFNPCGLKFRKSLIGKVPTLYPAQYKDWQEKIENANKDDDCAVKYIKFSPILYFMFLNRWPYPKYRRYSLSGDRLIKYIADCGFCGYLPKHNTSIFKNEKDKQNSINTEYFRRIEEVYNGGKFKLKLSMFKRKYIQVSTLIPYDLNLERGLL